MDTKAKKSSKVDEDHKKKYKNENDLKLKDADDDKNEFFGRALLLFEFFLTCMAIASIGYSVKALFDIVKVAKPAGLVASVSVIIVCNVVNILQLGACLYYYFERKTGPLALCVLAAILLIIPFIVLTSLGAAVLNFTFKDKEVIASSLENLFSQSKSYQSEDAKQFHHLQYSLKCCGLYNPDDYRLGNFLPNVPVSCCPEYDPTGSDIEQEDARRSCIRTKNFFSNGCRNTVIELIESDFENLSLSNWIVIAVDICIFILGVAAVAISKASKKKKTVDEA